MGLQNLKGFFSGNVEQYKDRLEANDLTQKKSIDYHGMSGSFLIESYIKRIGKTIFIGS
jgi:hypothetical protein